MRHARRRSGGGVAGAPRLVGLLLLAAVAAASGQTGRAQVRHVDGSRTTGELLGMSEAGELRLEIEDAVRTIPLSEVVSVELAAGASRPGPGAVRLDLVSGDRLHAVIEEGNYDEVRLSSPATGTVSFFLDDIDRIVYLDNLREDFELPEGPAKTDELYRAAGDRLERIPGELMRIERSGVVFTSAAGPDRPFSFLEDRVVGVRLARLREYEEPEALLCVARFRDGSRLTGVLRGTAQGVLRLELTLGPTVTLARRELKVLEFRHAAFRYLSDQEAASFEEVPFFEEGPRFGLLRDRGFQGEGPLRVGSVSFRKGLGLHARSRASFELGGRYERFRARVGVDPATRDGPVPGSVRMRILADGRTLWESPLLKAGAEPLPLDLEVAGARSLTIEVDFGDSHQTGARGVLGGAMVLR